MAKTAIQKQKEYLMNGVIDQNGYNENKAPSYTKEGIEVGGKAGIKVSPVELTPRQGKVDKSAALTEAYPVKEIEDDNTDNITGTSNVSNGGVKQDPEFTPAELAAAFKKDNEEVLALTVDTVDEADEDIVKNALKAYDGLEKEVQELLEAEKVLLDNLSTAITEAKE